MDEWVLDMLQSQTGFHTSHIWRAERDLLRASSGFGKERQHLARDGGIVDKAVHFSPLSVAVWQVARATTVGACAAAAGERRFVVRAGA